MSVFIPEHIQKVLSSSPNITAIVGNNIYPVVALKEPGYPLIAYNRTSTIAETTKDGRRVDITTCSLAIYDDNYDESLILVDEVRKALEGSSGVYERFEVVDSVFMQASEEFGDGKFVQIIGFNFETI